MILHNEKEKVYSVVPQELKEAKELPCGIYMPRWNPDTDIVEFVEEKEDPSVSGLVKTEKVSEILDFMAEFFVENRRDKYLQIHEPYRTGVGIYGETGVGKTAVLKLVLSEYRDKAIILVASDLQSLSKAIQRIRVTLESTVPIVVVFDEVTKIFEHRMEPLLEYMDGTSYTDGVFNILCSEHLYKYIKQTPALGRPGRIDRLYEITTLDTAALRSVLENTVKDIPEDTEISGIKRSEFVDKLLSKIGNVKLTAAKTRELVRNLWLFNMEFEQAVDRAVSGRSTVSFRPSKG